MVDMIYVHIFVVDIDICMWLYYFENNDNYNGNIFKKN